MNASPRFKPGEAVLYRPRNVIGKVEKEPVLDGGEYRYRVRLVSGAASCVESDLAPDTPSEESLPELAERGEWGQLQAFRTALTVERLTNVNANTLSSFRARRVLFQPYQYQPLLKFLQSEDRHLLIADEVGLGKTIEAGLILAELEAWQQELEKVLVVCPSQLREQWRTELAQKFGADFDIHDRVALQNDLTKPRQGSPNTRLARSPRCRPSATTGFAGNSWPRSIASTC